MVTNEIVMKREPTSINVDPELWREVKHAAIDQGEAVSDLFDRALRNELTRIKREGHKK